MSSVSADAATTRSYLYVPGDRRDRLAKAGTRGADALILDLEDSVAPTRKDQARVEVARWLDERLGEEPGSGSQLWIRINADSAAADIGATVSNAVFGLVVPKAEPSLLAEVDELLTRREREIGVAAGQLVLLPLIETAAGLLAAAQIATAPRVVRLGIGEADLTAELGLRPGPGAAELIPIRLQVVIASAAGGIAGPLAPMSADFRDLAALRASSEALLRLGFRARTAIHPAQIPILNEVFAPSADEIDRARRLVEAFDAAQRDGSGVITDEAGRMVDVAIVRSAREVLARAAGRGPGAG
jgi:citrate lyase subunit beta / citryl-CoA lyase